VEAYPLESLLSVRHHREEGAKRNVRLAEIALREAEQAILDRQRELEEFKLWRREEEDRRYDAIMGKSLSMRELDRFKAGLAELADRERRKAEDVAKARKQAEAAAKDLDKARTLAKQAQKNTAKITAHKDIWQEEAKKEAEHKEDLELEEFRPLSRKGAEAEGEDA